MSEDLRLDLIGDDELLAAFRELEYKTQHRALKRIVSNAANIYVKAAKRQVPIRKTRLQPTPGTTWRPPGTSRKAIMKKMGRSRRTATVFVGPRTGPRADPKSAWYLKFPEYGTSKMQPFAWFRIAYASNKDKVERNMMKSMRTIIERTWAKKVKKGIM